MAIRAHLRSSAALAFSVLLPAVAWPQDRAFKDAFALYQAGSVTQARELLMAAVQANPSALDLSLLGSIEFQQGNLPAAEKYLRQALTVQASLPGTRLTLGSVLEAEGKTVEAQKSFEHVLVAGPHTKDALLGASRCALSNRQITKARQWADQAVLLAPHETPALLLAARIRNLQGDTEGALAVLLGGERAAPNDPAILYAAGVLCLQMDLLKDATSKLERAVQLQPDNAAALYALASARIAARDFPAAIKIYEHLRLSGRDDAQVSYALGATYFLAGNSTAAKTSFERSLQWAPNQVESLYYLGLIARQEGDSSRSIDLLKSVLARRADHLRAHIALGMAYRTTGQLADAEREMESAIRLDPRSQKAHYQLGLILSALQQRDRAKQELDTASKLRAATDDKVSWELASP